MSIILNSFLPFLKSHVYSQRNKSNDSFENRWCTLLVLWMLTVIRFNIIGRIQFPFERIASKGILFFVSTILSTFVSSPQLHMVVAR